MEKVKHFVAFRRSTDNDADFFCSGIVPPHLETPTTPIWKTGVHEQRGLLTKSYSTNTPSKDKTGSPKTSPKRPWRAEVPCRPVSEISQFAVNKTPPIEPDEYVVRQASRTKTVPSARKRQYLDLVDCEPRDVKKAGVKDSNSDTALPVWCRPLPPLPSTPSSTRSTSSAGSRSTGSAGSKKRDDRRLRNTPEDISPTQVLTTSLVKSPVVQKEISALHRSQTHSKDTTLSKQKGSKTGKIVINHPAKPQGVPASDQSDFAWPFPDDCLPGIPTVKAPTKQKRSAHNTSSWLTQREHSSKLMGAMQSRFLTEIMQLRDEVQHLSSVMQKLSNWEGRAIGTICR